MSEKKEEPTEFMFEPAMLERCARAAYNYLYLDSPAIGAKVPGQPEKTTWEDFSDGNKAIWKVTIAVALNEHWAWFKEQLMVPVPPDAFVVRTDKDGKEVPLH